MEQIEIKYSEDLGKYFILVSSEGGPTCQLLIGMDGRAPVTETDNPGIIETAVRKFMSDYPGAVIKGNLPTNQQMCEVQL